MSRVEKGSDVTSQMVKMKEEVKEEVKRTGKKRRPAVGCCLIFLLVVLACAGWIVWSLAATGLVFQPDGFLVRAAYREPAPREIIKPSVPIETVLQAEIMKPGPISVTLTQEQMTASLRNLVDRAGYGLQSERAQIAIDEDGIEIFVSIERGEHKSAAIMVGEVTVDDSAPRVHLDEIYIGAFHVPNALTRSLVTRVANTLLASLTKQIGDSVVFDSLSYGDGRVTLIGALNLDVVSPK